MSFIVAVTCMFRRILNTVEFATYGSPASVLFIASSIARSRRDTWKPTCEISSASSSIRARVVSASNTATLSCPIFISGTKEEKIASLWSWCLCFVNRSSILKSNFTVVVKRVFRNRRSGSDHSTILDRFLCQDRGEVCYDRPARDARSGVPEVVVLVFRRPDHPPGWMGGERFLTPPRKENR